MYAYIYFDQRDEEWSVHENGHDLSDLAAVHSPWPLTRELGEDAILLNMEAQRLRESREFPR